MYNKIGIITLNGYYNYGNRLQNYALQEVLRSLGYEVDTLLIEKEKSEKQEEIKNRNILNILQWKMFLESNQKVFLKKLNAKLWYQIHKKSSIEKIKVRGKRFEEYSKKYISEVPFPVEKGELEKLMEYSFFVAGSDQIWNPYYNQGNNAYFLTFAPKEKRIAYAASFGISKLPESCIKQYQQYLSEFQKLSVREEDGSNIIEELTGEKALVVVDPTLLLSKEKWIQVGREHDKKPKDAYLLTYFLGEQSKEVWKKIKDIAKEKRLKIVRLYQIKDKAYSAGPQEFIDYIQNCKLMFTDSYHGCIFSILFERPFVVFDRKEEIPTMGSRIDTLLTMFDLQGRRWERVSNKRLFRMDYSHITPILVNERKKAIDYLKDVRMDKDNT